MNRRTALIALCAGVLTMGGWWALQQRNAVQLPPIGAASAQDAAAEVDTSSIEEMTLGDADAPVTLVEYASFTCPHCANFHDSQFKKLKTDYIDTGKVHFIYRDVYFDRLGLWAALVARCDPERFFGVSDLLYSQQRDWIGEGDPNAVVENLRRIGRVAGLDEEGLNTCLADNDKARTLVAWYQQNAEADEINSTPSLMIDGQKYSNMPYDELSALIDKKLAAE
ncbi:DsbA family protein [Sediminimonas sp.]|uniref:DsbA family protein n=1 Tax=Sediminimonas sp. TaxID=2823379 RepID=UPI0025E6CA45|nr:DsbA family protein [Sediminimonas sp.]